MSDTPQINPFEDQRKRALELYDSMVKECHHWSSFIQRAIESYNPDLQAQLSSKEQELREEKYKVRNLLELLEQTEAELDAKADKEQEFEELKRINSEYKQLLNPILNWGQTEGLEHGLKLGESITTTVLNRAKEYNQLRAENERLKEVLSEKNRETDALRKVLNDNKRIEENEIKDLQAEVDRVCKLHAVERKRCEDLEAILDNNGLSWTYKNLSQ